MKILMMILGFTMCIAASYANDDFSAGSACSVGSVVVTDCRSTISLSGCSISCQPGHNAFCSPASALCFACSVSDDIFATPRHCDEWSQSAASCECN
jgi:hypothetical protein